MKRLMILAAMTGCATSYERATSVQLIGGGAFLITADGNGWTGSSTIEQYKYRRATEVCPNGFDVIDANASMRTSLATFDGGQTYNTINKPSGSLAIVCKQQRVARAQPRTPTGGFWCSTNRELSIGSCFPSLERCSAFRSALLKECPEGAACESTECATRNLAFCAPTSGCYETQDACFKLERYGGRDGSACQVAK